MSNATQKLFALLSDRYGDWRPVERLRPLALWGYRAPDHDALVKELEAAFDVDLFSLEVDPRWTIDDLAAQIELHAFAVHR